MNIYTGYVYIWLDTRSKFYYIGSHQGYVDDCYICSNTSMLRAYKLRPETFKMRVLQYGYGDYIQLRSIEQKWLNLIKDEELMISENIKNNTCRYYNVKKTAHGGSHKGHTKNRIKPAWNAKTWKVTDPFGNSIITSTLEKYCKSVNISFSSLYLSHRNKRPASRGSCLGWRLELIDSVSKFNQQNSDN